MEIIDILNSKKVAVVKNTKAFYPSRPFNPSENYPEYPFKKEIGLEQNIIYDMVRNLFYCQGFDLENYGTPEWNPLGVIIKPGDKVLLKPNLVRHYHPYDMDVLSIFTHGSVIRVLIDYAYIALQGKGEIVIGDAPLQSCDFDVIKEIAGLNEIEKFYSNKKLTVNIMDFRLVRAFVDNYSMFGDVLRHENLSGDPSGYTRVNIGSNSLLEPVSDYYRKFRVTCYNPAEMTAHHRQEVHEYIIPHTVLKADVIINLPKMKTHHKAGITGAMKNVVGINGHKDWLPHHRKGSKEENGDEYFKKSYSKKYHSWIVDKKEMSQNLTFKKFLSLIEKVMYRLSKKMSGDPFSQGSWWGNDTIWRTIIDLNKIILFADKSGNLTDSIQRKVFSLVDGIIAGESDGPLAPTPKKCGVLLCGFNIVAVDTVMAQIMGFDFGKIPQINNSYAVSNNPLARFSPDKIAIALPDNIFVGLDSIPESYSLMFLPSYGWRGHIEL